LIGDEMQNKKMIFYIIFIAIISLSLIAIKTISNLRGKDNSAKVETSEVTVLSNDGKIVTVVTNDDKVIKLELQDKELKKGDILILEYTGILSDSTTKVSSDILNYRLRDLEKDDDGVPIDWKDNGIFSDYYLMAYNKLQTMTLNEKIGQLLLVNYQEDTASSAISEYGVGGFVFYEKDFKDKSTPEVQQMIEALQSKTKIPLLTAVDEEGGSVVRISSNSNLVSEKFKSPQELYTSGDFAAIKEDTIKKSEILSNLGLNLNLAPVVDVSTNASDYIYNRTLGKDSTLTSTYAKTVIEASKKNDVSYTLKHFPGYASNTDTHIGSSTDNRSFEEIKNNDLPPFEAGIKAGAEAVMFSHNIVTSIDSVNPSSLSKSVHDVLTTDLKYTGVSITDDLSMNALNSIDNKVVKALQAGNEIIMITDFAEATNDIKKAVNDGTLDESVIDKATFKVLSWKYYKGLMNNNK